MVIHMTSRLPIMVSVIVQLTYLILAWWSEDSLDHQKTTSMAVIQTFSTAVLVSTCLLLSVTAVRYPMTTTVDKQISTLRNLGYDIYKLDHSTQLRVFLYTWLSMERGEMGLVII